LDFPKPGVVISRCIEFENVRWDGQIINNDFVRRLLPYVKPITVCPEIGVDLPVPRDPIRIVRIESEDLLLQPSTGRNLTDEMKKLTENFLENLPPVDGFIMKSRSPSCGITNVKIYAGLENDPVIDRGAGMFGRYVKDRFWHLAVEDDYRLSNYEIRENFLRKLYVLADFRENTVNKIGDLVEFHSRQKTMLKAYNKSRIRIMENIISNHNRKPFDVIHNEYQEQLYNTIVSPPRYGKYTKVLQNCLGYFSNKISESERNFFLDTLEQYRQGRVPLIVPLDVMKSWILRFDEKYLSKQSFFYPYPENLIDINTLV
jgi:uncharacterized protein YbgA (DUF1722 family)/uncharacterized protein YbbK (DUF523 family)